MRKKSAANVSGERKKEGGREGREGREEGREEGKGEGKGGEGGGKGGGKGEVIGETPSSPTLPPTILICLHLQQVVKHLVWGSLDDQVPPQCDSLKQHDLTTMFSQFHCGGLHLQEDATKVHLLDTQEGTVVLTRLNGCTPERKEREGGRRGEEVGEGRRKERGGRRRGEERGEGRREERGGGKRGEEGGEGRR